MGSGEVSNGYRERLERNLDSLQSMLQKTNERNKPQPIQPRPRGNHAAHGSVAGGAIGGAIGGPPGAIIGTVLGGIFGSLF